MSCLWLAQGWFDMEFFECVCHGCQYGEEGCGRWGPIGIMGVEWSAVSRVLSEGEGEWAGLVGLDFPLLVVGLVCGWEEL